MSSESIIAICVSFLTLGIAIWTVKAQARKDRAERDSTTQQRISQLEILAKDCDHERAQLVKDNYRLLRDNLELTLPKRKAR